MKNKLTSLFFVALGFISLYSPSSMANLCYPGTVQGLSYYPIALVDYNTVTKTYATLFGRIEPNFSTMRVRVYLDNLAANTVDYLGEYGMSDVAMTDCDYYYPYAIFKVNVMGDDGNTWASLYKENELTWSNRVKWQGGIYERSSLNLFWRPVGNL